MQEDPRSTNGQPPDPLWLKQQATSLTAGGRWRKLKAVCRQTRRAFKKTANIKKIRLNLFGEGVDYRITVFCRTDEDLVRNTSNGANQRIESYARQLMADNGLGNASVGFIFDSHQRHKQFFKDVSERSYQQSVQIGVVCKAARKAFKAELGLREIVLFEQIDVDWRVYVFWLTDQDRVDNARGQTHQRFEAFVRQQMQQAGLLEGPGTTIAFEYDSHESVKRDFGGDYRARLA